VVVDPTPLTQLFEEVVPQTLLADLEAAAAAPVADQEPPPREAALPASEAEPASKEAAPAGDWLTVFTHTLSAPPPHPHMTVGMVVLHVLWSWLAPGLGGPPSRGWPS
jgi:hypothetical protein